MNNGIWPWSMRSQCDKFHPVRFTQ
jgi:hypothetical protein